ncbi:type II toxin-antitoxin system VapC family toxin [Actinokineospora sp. NBRC 105648]|uniref:type II toxin-antitoxin system VapC family toxin n=1 Tax=Actinokineospora sp. NBRC 105648 TaxID=3032206 RepID=UPI0024A592C7|nr:type II toxin-antitoxin system VapC family toxin [Actinokineospora sp. NBRC 105648]GLZ41353.1 hypothetical protein Acsp05_49770 [Actinokineospora sp. NBRC 105648]
MSSFVVVDTDVFSRLWQNRKVAPAYVSALRGVTPVLSFTSVAEAYFGASYANWGQRRRAELEAAIRRYVIAPYTPEIAVLWADLKSRARKTGHSLGQAQHTNDLWICATAIFHDSPLMTDNVRHFDGMPGLTLIRP